MEIIDLSVLLSEDLPTTWPTEPQFQMKMSNWFRNEEVYGVTLKSGGPYQSRALTMSDHSGTHCDAPVHFVPPENSDLAHAGPLGSKTAEQLDLRQLVGPAVVIDCRCTRENAQPRFSPMIGPRLITNWEAQHGRIDPGTIVLFWTGWDDLYLSGAEGQKYYSRQGFLDDPGWPAPSPEALECLLERGGYLHRRRHAQRGRTPRYGERPRLWSVTGHAVRGAPVQPAPIATARRLVCVPSAQD